jgi:diaminopimelate epimerase
MAIEYTKMHGLGNDFVFIDQDILCRNLSNDFVVKICDRRIGLGCDQLILYRKLADRSYLMEIYNTDGSKADMCGNASRCLALYAYKKYQEDQIEIMTGSRIISATVNSSNTIGVNMGQALFTRSWMPQINELANIAADYGLNLKEMIFVDVGNRHIVIFYQSLSQQEKVLLGQVFQRHILLSEGINVNFAKIDCGIIYLEVFERGVGFTLACGSGACATFAAAEKLQFALNSATIRFKIGDLHMSYSGQNIIMSGPAIKVASGYYYG